MPEKELPFKVVLIDYSPELYSPVGFEAEMLAQAGAKWETYRCRTGEEVVSVAQDADVVAVQSVRPLLTREVLAQLNRCRCTIRAGAGYDSIDYKAATELGIMVCNAPTYCTDDVADHAVGLMLAAVRNIPRLDAALRKGRYARELARPSRRVAGSTVGIIGLGRIGSTTAKRVRGWDVTVLAYDPYVGQDHADTVGARMVDLDELLARSDFISIHCLLSDETYHLLSWDEFAKMKEGVILVNTARGPIVDENALVAALQEGRVWAAGLDVTEQEPLPPDSPLLQMDNVILTPHVSANTPESQRDLYRLVCEISIDVIQGRIPQWVVNPEVLDHLKKVD
ncbi:MAG: C-terminal binding protein [Chloroflexi bacterium]|nr:C-terminal binding protein [Chloroflexota bacterium]